MGLLSAEREAILRAVPHDAAQSGALRFTERMTRVLTVPLKYQIQRALREFPELESQPITVGLTRSSGVDGIAYAEQSLIRLHVRRGRVSSFTIGHELTHLLQTPGLGIVPSGEIPCDIWTLARSEVFLDGKPGYLPIPCRREDWSHHAHAVRRLCLRAIEERRRNRRYMVWLQHHIRAYFARPVPLTLFDMGGHSTASPVDRMLHDV